MDKAGLTLGKVITGNPLYDQELELAPWEIKPDHFGRIDCRELIAKSLDLIKKEHVLLVLASLDGHRYANTILIDFDRDGLTIDRPNSFDEESVDWLRVYFKDLLGIWSFIQVQTRPAGESLDAIRATYPECLFRLQTRRYNRVVVPRGTRVLFLGDGQRRGEGLVMDLSAGGMLIRVATAGAVFQPETVISEIAITLPALAADRQSEPPALPVIKKGRIVRTTLDSTVKQLCLGVAFEGEAESAEELADCVEIIKDRMLGKG